MSSQLHDLIHLLSQMQKLLDKLGKIVEKMVQDDELADSHN